MIILKDYFDDLRMREHPTITNVDMFNKIWNVVEKISDLKETIDILDYHLSANNTITINNTNSNYQVIALVKTGGNEGIYINFNLVDYEDNNNIVHIGTIKTLYQDVNSYMLMGKLAGALTILGDNFLFFNF